MNAAEFNALYSIGVPVFAYPGARPEDIPSAPRLVTRTRSKAQVCASGHDVVWVEGEGAYIALSHVDPVTEDEYNAAKLAEAVAELGALPVPAGNAPRTLDVVEHELTGANLSLYEEELESARLRLAWASARRGRRQLRAEVASLRAERHTTNEALDDAVQSLRELKAAPVTIYRAEHPDSGITLGHYGTEAAARAHCEATERRSWPTGTSLTFDWIRDALPEDEGNGVAELVVTAGQNEESTTGYIVTALELDSEYDAEADE